MRGAFSASEGMSPDGAAAAGREQFSSSFAFVLAALGSAVGLGNIWRFPYVAGEHGGGAFVLVYLLAIIGIGLPALIATVLIGRKGSASPIECLVRVARAEGRSRHWGLLGWMLVIGAFLLLSLFSVIAGWILAYLLEAGRGAFQSYDQAAAVSAFDRLKADPARMAMFHGLFMLMTLLIVARGVRHGIERAVKLLMPLLFFLMFALAVHAMLTGAGARTLTFLFSPDFSRLGPDGALLAIGQALLSLSVGGAGMLVYGAYLSRTASIPKTCMVIALADTGAALLAGLMIFPIVFAFNMEPAQGPGLIFITLPIAFGQMPFGSVIAVAFFLLLLIAALTSAISMLEPVVAWASERFGLKRPMAALLSGGGLWLIGLASVFSFNAWSDLRPLAAFGRLADYSLFQSLEYGITSILLPVSTFLLTLFAGWMIGEATRRAEFGMTGATYSLWRASLRFGVPAVLLLVFAMAIRGGA